LIVEYALMAIVLTWTRTIFFGKPRGEIMKIYSAVRLAQEGAIAAAKPGVSGRELDAVARKIIGDLGMQNSLYMDWATVSGWRSMKALL